MDSLWHFETPLGIMRAVDDGEGLSGLFFGKLEQLPEGTQQACTPLLVETQRQLFEYFLGLRQVFDLPLSLSGTPFQLEVWQALLCIPYGGLCTYGEIAQAIGRPNAVRAVGMANNRNPISIIIPCHRVVGKNGALTGYAGGLDVKEELIAHEYAHRHNA